MKKFYSTALLAILLAPSFAMEEAKDIDQSLNNENSSNFAEMPPELKLHILNHLNQTEEKKDFSLICGEWQDLISVKTKRLMVKQDVTDQDLICLTKRYSNPTHLDLSNNTEITHEWLS